MLFREFEEASPDLKVLLSLSSGGIITALALLLCSISHTDPLGMAISPAARASADNAQPPYC